MSGRSRGKLRYMVTFESPGVPAPKEMSRQDKILHYRRFNQKKLNTALQYLKENGFRSGVHFEVEESEVTITHSDEKTQVIKRSAHSFDAVFMRMTRKAARCVKKVNCVESVVRNRPLPWLLAWFRKK